MRDKRIAICISGQVRISDERLAMIAKEASDVGADVFISVWRKRGGKSFGSGHKHINLFRIMGSQIGMYFPRNWCQGFEGYFPGWPDMLPKSKSLSKTHILKIFPKAIVEVEDDNIDLDIPNEQNSLRMLYKIWRCNGLKRKHEKDHGFAYDRVIRSRPDILINFKALVDAPCEENQLLVKLRRGQTLHDTYWAGNSETDDLMAGMFGHTLANRMEEWTGIHHELVDYVQDNEIEPTNIRCIKKDFLEFGDYSDLDRTEITRNFLTQLLETKMSLAQNSSTMFADIMEEVLSNACSEVIDGSFAVPSEEMLEKTSTFLSDASPDSDSWHALIPVSLACARDQKLDPNLRGFLAFQILLEDALTWPNMLGLRIANIGSFLPDGGTELLPFIEENSFLEKLESDHPLVLLWRKRLIGADDKKTSAARSRISIGILNNNELRGQISGRLQANGSLDQLLKFAESYKNAFPERKNSEHFVAHTKMLIQLAQSK